MSQFFKISLDKYMDIYAYIYTLKYIHMNTYLHVCICPYLHKHIAHVCVSTCVCMRAGVCVYTHIYILITYWILSLKNPNTDGLSEVVLNRQAFLHFLNSPQAMLSSFLVLECFQYGKPGVGLLNAFSSLLG